MAQFACWKLVKRSIVVGALISTVVIGQCTGSQERNPKNDDSLTNEFTLDERVERFRLFNFCGPIDFVIEGLSEDASGINLNTTALTTVVESRLRSARLYDAEASPYIYLNVTVVGRAFSVSLNFKKDLYDRLSGEYLPATTWNDGVTGTHGSQPSFVVSAVSQLIDQFLVEYLRVNESDCD